MKKTNKLISILLVLAMLLSMAPIAVFTASAETISGTAGTVRYTIDEYGVMTISGSGTIPQGFDSSSYINPNHNQLVKRIVIEDGITGIGQQSLDTFYNLTSVSIAKTVTSIGQYTFTNEKNIKTITYWGTSRFTTTNILNSSVTPTIYVKTNYSSSTMFGKSVTKILTDTSKECTVKFDMNGYGTQVDSQYVLNIDGYNKVTKPTDPSAPEVKFEGWYKDSEFNTAWNFDTDTVSDNTTIYAKWNTTPDHTVSFNIGSYGTTISDRGVVNGSLIAEPETPTDDDALFLGWYKDSGFETPWDFANDTVTSDTTLYAKWRLWYGTAPSTGDGSESNPFEIGTADELYWFADYYNNSGKLSSAYAVLVDDITVNQSVLNADGTLNGDGSTFRVWQPIGTSSQKYVGTFDGQGHTVSGLYFNNTDTTEGKYVGFVGYLGSSSAIGTVKNLEIADSYFKGYQNVGSLVGTGQNRTNCKIDNCASSATVYAQYRYAGGIAGNYATVNNCIFAGNVAAANYAGGIIGYNNSSISNCLSVGKVKADTYAGAIAAYHTFGTHSNCYYLIGSAVNSNNVAQKGLGTNASTANTTGENSEYFGVNATQLASGEIAYKLQGAQEDDSVIVWGQQLTGENADAYPTLGGPRVVPDTATGTYINSEEGSSHTRVRGYCCDQDYDEPVLVDGDNYASLGLTSDYIGYYAISNYGQLYGFAKIVNGGDYDANAVLTDNITANENVLKPDGTLNGDEQSLWQWNPILPDGSVESSGAQKYEGTFDGNNKYISGLYYNNTVGAVRGLFGYVGTSGVVKDLGIIDSYFYGQRSLGAIVGYNLGNIINCYNESTVKAYPKSSTGMMNDSGIIGGIVGYNQGTIMNCYNKGYISGSNVASNVGGIAGLTSKTIDGCYNLGVIDGDSSVGGIVGTLYDASITNSYNKGNVTASGYIGGIAGWGSHNDSTAIPLIEKCWNSGTLTATSNNSRYAGGIVGVQRDKNLTIKDCYNTGIISAKGLSGVGGIIGLGKGSAVIETSYNYGEIVGATYTGGIIGEIGTAYGEETNNDITITNCYYLEGCAVDSNDTVQNGVGNETAGSTTEDIAGEVTALTIEQMTDDTNWKTNFAGFDTNNVWSKNTNTVGVWYLPKLDSNSPSFVPPHIHSFTYSSSGDTITATCTADGCPNTNGGTLNISAPADLYADGTTAKEATVENNLVDTSVAVNVTYSTVDGTAPKTAGTYTASVTVGGATASVQFELVKRSAIAENFVYTAPENLVYDGTAKYATVEVASEITGLGEITVTYYKDGEAVEPIDAGTYTVKVSTADSDKYYAINDIELASFTIDAKDISDGFIILGEALTYNGTEQTQTVEKVLATGTAPEATYTVSGNKATNVGVYLLTVTGTGNFTGEAKIAYEIAVDMNGVDFDQLHPLNVKATDKEKIEYIYNQLDNAFRDYADEEKRNEWDNNKSYCVELLKMIESVANHIESFKNKLAGYDIDTVTSDDADDLESFYNDEVSYLYDNYFDNLTEEQTKELDDILSDISALQKRISDVAKEITRITNAVNSYDEATVKYSDYKDILQLINDIEALTDGQNITDDERASLEELNTKANILAAKIRSTADEISRITRAVNAYNIDTVKSSDKADIENLIARISKLTDGDNISADERANLNELDSILDALLAKIDETADELARLEAEADKYDEATVKSSDKADIEQLKADNKELADGQNITADEKAKLENLDATADALLAKIAETKSEYDRVIAAANGYDEATVTSADKDALVQLNDDIYALALTDNVTEDEKANLQAAHDKVLGLIDKLTAISEEIKRIIEAVDKYVFESVKSIDKADIEQLIADIKTLLDTQNITADERALLEGADETCTKLIEKIDETVAEISRINDATNTYEESTVTSADKADIEKFLADIKALTDGDNITDAEREQLNGNEATLNALLDKIGATADEIERIEKAVNGYDEESVKSTDKADLEKLIEDIKALTDATNITEEERAELGELDATVDSLIKKIDDTAAEIARIDEAVNSYDKETVTSDDVPALGKLIEDIKALTDGDNITEDEKAALEANDEAIDELIEKLAEVAEEIKRVDETVKSYDEDTVKSTDKEDLTQLKDDVQALIDSTNTTENEKTALEEMIKDIEGLEGKIEEIEQQLEEIAGIESNYNPETVTSDDKATIEETIAEIDAVNPDNLTDEQKAEYAEIKTELEALLEEIAAAEKDVADIGVELEILNEKRVTIFWEDDIEALKAKVDELLADENMGEAEKAKLNEYKVQAEKLIEIINTPKEYFSLRFFYLIWDCLTWKYNGILWLFSKIFGC